MLSVVWYLHRGAKFFQSGVVIFVAVLLHNGLGYLLGYGAGKLVGMNTSKKRTISIEVGMQNAGLATNLATAELLVKALERGDLEWREMYR